jgi:bifunctional oligoribonuclease and PAP phosphatase NrnA
MSKPDYQKVYEYIQAANNIVIIQADNPDGDSLGSALALEEMLGEMGKTVHLYCGVSIPDYLKHIHGWDRVSDELPTQFDLSIIVDTSALILLEKLETGPYRSWVASKPVIVMDHHGAVVSDIPYATLVVNDDKAVATGEMIYKLAKEHNISLNLQALSHIATSILSDSLGLTSEGTTAETYHVMGELIANGVDRPALEEARRATTKMPEEIYRYKAELINRTMFVADGRIAHVSIPHEEIMTYSPLYNPAPLIQNDMLQIKDVGVAIVFKHYKDGKITGSIRCGYGITIAHTLAMHFGGGGHPYASGFKVTNGKSFNEVKSECLQKATELLDNLNEGSSDASIQHADTNN